MLIGVKLQRNKRSLTRRKIKLSFEAPNRIKSVGAKNRAAD
jgi:hypothetical protein